MQELILLPMEKANRKKIYLFGSKKTIVFRNDILRQAP